MHFCAPAIYSFMRFGNRPAHLQPPKKKAKSTDLHAQHTHTHIQAATHTHTNQPTNQHEDKPQKQSDSDRHQKPKSSFQVSFSTGARKGPRFIQHSDCKLT